MQEHPIPRQITTFEFKLIGELTIKQFGYLAFGAGIAVILFFLTSTIPIPYLNLLIAAVPALIGIGFAFVPINDRPMDIWLRNLFKRLMSPTQYFYHKHNLPPKILLGITLPPREQLLQHVKAQAALKEYLAKKPKTEGTEAVKLLDDRYNQKKQSVQALMLGAAIPVPEPKAYTPVSTVISETPTAPATLNFEGTVATANGISLPNLLVYVKQGSETVRLFKTDANGHFLNNLPLPPGDYFLEIADPQKKHTFARMKLEQTQTNLQIFAQS